VKNQRHSNAWPTGVQISERTSISLICYPCSKCPRTDENGLRRHLKWFAPGTRFPFSKYDQKPRLQVIENDERSTFNFDDRALQQLIAVKAPEDGETGLHCFSARRDNLERIADMATHLSPGGETVYSSAARSSATATAAGVSDCRTIGPKFSSRK